MNVLSLYEVAERLGISQRQVRYLIRAQKIEGKAIGGTEKHPGGYVVDTESVQRYLEQYPTGRQRAPRKDRKVSDHAL